MKFSCFNFLSVGGLLMALPSSNAFTPNNNNVRSITATNSSCNNSNSRNSRNSRNTATTKLFKNSNNNYDDSSNPLKNLFTFITTDPVTNAKKKLVRSLAGNYDKEQIQNELQSLITNEPLLMLSFTTCPYCIKAKQILDAKKTPSGQLQYKVLELNAMEDGNAYRAEMAEIINRTSVPAIWINGKFIGGCNDGGENNKGIVQLDESGKLDIMLKEAGVL